MRLTLKPTKGNMENQTYLDRLSIDIQTAYECYEKISHKLMDAMKKYLPDEATYQDALILTIMAFSNDIVQFTASAINLDMKEIEHNNKNNEITDNTTYNKLIKRYSELYKAIILDTLNIFEEALKRIILKENNITVDIFKGKSNG